MASLCKFGALQDEMVHNQLVVYINCDKIREILLLENYSLKLTEAVNIAVQVKSVLGCAASLSAASTSLGPNAPLPHISADHFSVT